VAECEWAVICDYAFLDSQGKACIIGIFDGIYAKAVPVIHRQATLVVQLRGAPREAVSVRTELVRPNGGGLTKVEGHGELSPTGVAGLQLRLGPMNLPDYGQYSCNIAVNDQQSYVARFDVRKPPTSGVN